MPTLAIIHNNIDDRSSIGSIAAWDAREALKRGWDVLAVCRDLDPHLADSVTHVPLYVPPRLHLLQYAVGRETVRRALRKHRPDVVMTHQPQSAGIADIWNVHYLERAARDVAVEPASGLRSRLADLSSRGVARVEDRFLRSVPESTRILFCGDSVRDDFAQIYGDHPNGTVLYNPAPSEASVAPLPEPDVRRRTDLVGAHQGPVIGFLGGGDTRKGADLVRAAIQSEPELFLLHAGPTLLSMPDTAGRHRAMGNLADVTELLDAVDVLLLPSRFDPFPLVVAEAVSRGVPVLVSNAVGSSKLVLATGAGAIWNGDEALTPLVKEMIARRAEYVAGGRAFLAALDRDVLAEARFREIASAAARRL